MVWGMGWVAVGIFVEFNLGLTVRYRLGVFALAGWLSVGCAQANCSRSSGWRTQGQLTQVRVGIVVVGGGGCTF